MKADKDFRRSGSSDTGEELSLIYSPEVILRLKKLSHG